MLKLHKDHLHQLEAVSGVEELHPMIQRAIELEHATIPPYLTALFSLKPDRNRDIAELIRSVVIEEMSHMTIAANLLIATGGSPQINTPDFIPQYPGPLPMGIADGLQVPIKAFSRELVKDVFMEIEEPEDPVPVGTEADAQAEYATIGAYYRAIQKKIAELGDDIFVGNTDRQVLSWFSDECVFPIVDVKSALAAIDVIVVEGEGTSSDPFQSPGDPAHYYTFGEIYYGHKITRKGDGYAYEGKEVPLDESGIYPLKPNCKIDDFKRGTRARRLLTEYSYSYSKLLNALHHAFNGHPNEIDTAMGLMYQLKLQAAKLMQEPAPKDQDSDKDMTLGPSYEYITDMDAIG